MRRVALVLATWLAWVAVARAQPGDWTVKRDPFDKTVIARYKAILAGDPYDRALTTLLALYRKHRTVALLEQEYAGRDDWAGLVVRARLAQTANDKLRALELFARAVAVKDTDALGWIAIGDASKRDDARGAYERALAQSPPVPLRKATLRKLIALGGDPTHVDRLYMRLLDLDAKNGRLWLERADALAAAKLPDQAIASYTTAEALLAADPERRLYAISQLGVAHEQARRFDTALAEYNRAIAASPRGYFLRHELVDRIIKLHQSLGTLGQLLREYQRTWPEKSRGHFEWVTLGRLHELTGAPDAAILALQQAVKKAPAELATHRQLVKLLDAAGRGDDALAQLEAAARAGPRDARIQFELVERTWTTNLPKTLATLAKLGRALANNAGVRRDIAETYMKLRRVDLALKEYEAVAALEPDDDDNILLLGDAYWVAGLDAKAIRTWRRLARSGAPQAYATFANVLFEHELFEDAIDAYSRALDRDDRDPELWRGRGAVYEAQRRWSSALADTELAVRLVGNAPRDKGHATRYQLIRILTNMRADEEDQLEARIADWELKFAVDDDIAAGYMLAEAYGTQPDVRLERILSQLRKHVPDDDGVALELIRTYRVLKRYDHAARVLAELQRKRPARKQELDTLAAKIADERLRVTQEDLDSNDILIQDPEWEIRAARGSIRVRDAVHGAPVRGGVRVGVGAGVRGPASRALTFGAIGTFGTGPIAFVTRFDWSQRESDMRSVSAIGGSFGVAGRVITTPDLAVTLGAAQRIERRLGDMVEVAGFERTGFAADFTLDLVARNWPTALGVRFEQALSEHARDSSLLVEMSIEMR